eukprot:jgi/Psemu1/33748/gm1.33748_g
MTSSLLWHKCLLLDLFEAQQATMIGGLGVFVEDSVAVTRLLQIIHHGTWRYPGTLGGQAASANNKKGKNAAFGYYIDDIEGDACNSNKLVQVNAVMLVAKTAGGQPPGTQVMYEDQFVFS